MPARGSIYVEAPRLQDARVTAVVQAGDRRREITFEVKGATPSATGDAWVAAALLPAMRLGGDLEVKAAVSPRLLAAGPKIQRLVHSWDRSFREIGVRVPGRAPGPRGAEVACLFSGGVDSFHALLRHRDRIGALVFIHGFDLDLGRPAIRERVSAGLRRAAGEFGVQLIEVETDVRGFTDPLVPWRMSHGSIGAAVAHLLAPRFGTVYVPGSLSYANVHPYGSHPLLDPFWSTEETEIVYEGFDANRFEKVAAIARSDTALRWLRVCSGQQGDAYNCGRCEKCLRTMVALRAVGALDRATAFPDGIDPDALARMVVYREESRWFWEQTLAALETSGRDPELARAIRSAIAPRPGRLVRELRWRRRARRRRRRKVSG